MRVNQSDTGRGDTPDVMAPRINRQCSVLLIGPERKVFSRKDHQDQMSACYSNRDRSITVKATMRTSTTTERKRTMTLRNLYKMATLESMNKALLEYDQQATESRRALAQDIENMGYFDAMRLGADAAMEAGALGYVARLIRASNPCLEAGRCSVEMNDKTKCCHGETDGYGIEANHIWSDVNRDALHAASRMTVGRPEEVAQAKAWATIAMQCRNARRYVEQYGLQDANHRIHGSHAKWTEVMGRKAEDNEWGVPGGCECNFKAMLSKYPCEYCNEVEGAQRKQRRQIAAKESLSAIMEHHKTCRAPKS